jgi:hypothetical protein
MAKQLTIRDVSEAAVGPDERRRKLARYVTWTSEDLAEFNEALAAQRRLITRSGAEFVDAGLRGVFSDP